MMQIIPGSRVFSQFRKTRLLAQLQAVEPSIVNFEATYQHFLDLAQALDETETEQLNRLLSYGDLDSTSIDTIHHCHTLWVVPRLGTISPWSSKATEIIQRCGLQAVRRVERGMCFKFTCSNQSVTDLKRIPELPNLLHDRMTQSLISDDGLHSIFKDTKPAPCIEIPVLSEGITALNRMNTESGLGLSDQEIDYLLTSYQSLNKNPTDAELVMFAQVNSEHCRHKIFNADWIIDGESKDTSLFNMIRNSTNCNPEGILSAYHDNAAVIDGAEAHYLDRDYLTGQYSYHLQQRHIVMKVETHNHPTAISPHPGAATGVGGEIRDEAATGRGSTTKAGLTGFSVSHLRIPDYPRPWEDDFGKPDHLASALDIMLEAPIGGAAFGNEFGRPNLLGYFRTFEQRAQQQPSTQRHGYLKPIMIAGGVGAIRADQIDKQSIPDKAWVIVLGGPAMLIGLGGGAASSRTTTEGNEELDFASVQRENPEMQRRCQEVINTCWSLGDSNPILSIHDVGAGGLCNAVPELVHDAERSGRFQLRDVPCAEPGLSPMEIWCNEAQERFVLAVQSDRLHQFQTICERERCLFAVIGQAHSDQQLVVEDSLFQNHPVDLPMSMLFGNPPKMLRDTSHSKTRKSSLKFDNNKIDDAIERVLSFPAVADKSFLITIADRSVTGLVCRDQMVGPWQIPVADAAVTAFSYEAYTGEVMAMGERTPLAALDAPASGRMAIAEAITNLMCAPVRQIGDIKLSANWMAAANAGGEDARLFDTVQAVGMELCPALGIAIPVGKDSLSMQTSWNENNQTKTVISPVSLIITAYAPVTDVRKTLTPELQAVDENTVLLLIDLGQGKNRMGGSTLAQVLSKTSGNPPDLDNPEQLKNLFSVIQELNQRGLILAFHDRSDGGLLATLCEMAFAAHCGLDISLDFSESDALETLFNEELGVVIQFKHDELETVLEVINQHELIQCSHILGKPTVQETIRFSHRNKTLYSNSRANLQKIWSETSFQMQSLRDNPECARQQYEDIDSKHPGLTASLSFELDNLVVAPTLLTTRPKVAILREQGINGHMEMAAAFIKAGFDAIDVHMSDLVSGRHDLNEFNGLVACGGFSYGDVLGAGGGWAKSILFNPKLKSMFQTFFETPDRFGLGVCNGCQMLSQLKDLIPGADHWPVFLRNQSDQFEARVSMVEILPSPSIFLNEMAGSTQPVVVSHGEGRAEFSDQATITNNQHLIALRYTDYHGQATERYPMNPNGSPQGITGLTNSDGRFTIMMPHPERCFRTVQNSWHPQHWGENAPWLKMFINAREWIG